MGKTFVAENLFDVLFSPSLHFQSVVARSTLILKGKKVIWYVTTHVRARTDGLMYSFWSRRVSTTVSLWPQGEEKKNQLPHPVCLQHYKNRALDGMRLLIFAWDCSFFRPNDPQVLVCANTKCIASVQEGFDQRSVFRMAHTIHEQGTGWIINIWHHGAAKQTL